MFIYLLVHHKYTREIPTFGGIPPFGAPIWETAAFGGGERIIKNKEIGAPWAPHFWGAGVAPVWASAYAAFGSDK